MDFDSIAAAYRSLEYIAFGHRLERARFHFIDQLGGVRHALLLGDGDGRFLVELANRNREVMIDSIELSKEMNKVATHRLRAAHVLDPGRIRFIESDALSTDFPLNHYNLVATHFFLDCLSNAQVQGLTDAVRGACSPGAQWLISEFQQPASGWRRWHATLWLRTMYLFFGLATQLPVSRLPDYEGILLSSGWQLRVKKTQMGGLIASELWTIPSS